MRHVDICRRKGDEKGDLHQRDGRHATLLALYSLDVGEVDLLAIHVNDLVPQGDPKFLCFQVVSFIERIASNADECLRARCRKDQFSFHPRESMTAYSAFWRCVAAACAILSVGGELNTSSNIFTKQLAADTLEQMSKDESQTLEVMVIQLPASSSAIRFIMNAGLERHNERMLSTRMSLSPRGSCPVRFPFGRFDVRFALPYWSVSGFLLAELCERSNMSFSMVYTIHALNEPSRHPGNDVQQSLAEFPVTWSKEFYSP